MMHRNEAEFQKRQEELQEMLHVIATQSRASPDGKSSSPGRAAPATTAADRRIRALEEDLWNAELALEKSDREEAVCGAAVVRLADCIKASEERIRNVPERMASSVSNTREASAILLHCRQVVAKMASLPSSKKQTPGKQKPRIEFHPLPSDADLRNAGGSYTEAAARALISTTRSMALVLDEVSALRQDRLAGLQDALVTAQSRLDSQGLIIDDAHDTLLELQQDAERRNEDIEEEQFVIKKLTEQRASTSKRRQDLSAAVATLEEQLRRLKSTQESASLAAKNLEGEMNVATREREKAIKDAEEAMKKRAAVEEKTRSVRTATENAEAERTKQRRNNRSIAAQEDDLVRDLKALRETAKHNQDDAAKADQRRLKIQNELDKSSVEVRKAKRITEEINAEMAEIVRQATRLERESNGLKEELEELTKQVSTSREELETAKEKAEKEQRREKDLAEDLELANLVLTNLSEDPSSQPMDDSRAALMLSPEERTQRQTRGSAPPPDQSLSRRAVALDAEGDNVVYVAAAPSHYPPTVDLLPARDPRSTSSDRAGSRRTKRWGNSQSADRDPSEGGTSVTSALDDYYGHHGADSVPYADGTRRAVIDSDEPVGTLPLSPDRAPLLVSMEPRHSRRPPPHAPNRMDTRHEADEDDVGMRPSPYLQPSPYQQPGRGETGAAAAAGATPGSSGATGQLSMQEIRSRIERYSNRQ